MSENKQYLIKILFKNIKVNLIKKEDGSYIFKNNRYQLSSSITQGKFISDDDFSDIPSKEELCDYFEKEILAIIPHATLFINDNLSITVNIEKNPVLLKKIYFAKKELDVYESLKTLLFPTMKEFIAKFGDSKPKIIYSPTRKFKVEIYNIDKFGKKQGIKFVSHFSEIKRPIENTAIDFLLEDINYFISNLKFQNPIKSNALKLPQSVVTREGLRLYSYDQKIKFIKKLFEDFLEYYQYIIENNFPRIKHAFSLYNELPIKITLYTEKILNSISNTEDVKVTYTFEKLPKDSNNQVELKENQAFYYDPDKYLTAISTSFSALLIIHIFPGFYFRSTFSSPEFTNPYIAQRNALPFTYRHLKEELDDILEKIQSDAIFNEIKPFISHAESWVQIVLEAEKRGNEDYYIELKQIPTESAKKDGSGNDIYSEINAFENGEGGYLFIGVDENKSGLAKVVGLEGYFRDNNKNLDMVKREITDKCIKYLGKTYNIDADVYEGKTLIRIRVQSNYGSINYFKPEAGNECAYIRDNGKKRVMKTREIVERLIGNKLN